jgi:hypothetical protein
VLVAILSPVGITSDPRNRGQVTRSKSYAIQILGRKNEGTSDSNAPRQEADHSKGENEGRPESERTDERFKLSGPTLGSDIGPFDDRDCVRIAR